MGSSVSAVQVGAGFAAGAVCTGVGISVVHRICDRKAQEFRSFKGIKTVVVYAASSAHVDPVYVQAAQELGEYVALKGWKQVNGGGLTGLMGAATEGGFARGGNVEAVILDKFVGTNQHPGLRRVEVQNTMHRRKEGLYEKGDAFVALPGGLGTVEEIMEVLSWRQLGFHDKPVVFINTHGYYGFLADFIHHAVRERFVSDKIIHSFCIAPNAAEAIRYLENYSPLLIDKTEIHRGAISPSAPVTSDWEAAQRALHPPQDLANGVEFTVGDRVRTLTRIHLVKTGITLPPGVFGTVSKVPGDQPGTIAEVDIDDGPLVDVRYGQIELAGHSDMVDMQPEPETPPAAAAPNVTSSGEDAEGGEPELIEEKANETS